MEASGVVKVAGTSLGSDGTMSVGRSGSRPTSSPSLPATFLSQIRDRDSIPLRPVLTDHSNTIGGAPLSSTSGGKKHRSGGG